MLLGNVQTCMVFTQIMDLLLRKGSLLKKHLFGKIWNHVVFENTNSIVVHENLIYKPHYNSIPDFELIFRLLEVKFQFDLEKNL